MVISHSPPQPRTLRIRAFTVLLLLQDLKTMQAGHATGVTSNVHLALMGSKASFPA